MNARLFCSVTLILFFVSAMVQDGPLPVAVVGLSHGHVHWIFNSKARGDIEIAGIVESDLVLAKRYAEQYDYPLDQIYADIGSLLANKKIVAVTAFGNTYDHLDIVEICAPRGIHVMVEKPLAVNLKHARKMRDLAEEYGIHLITNYETTWYPTNHKAYALVHEEDRIGELRKIVVRDGHKGPKNIGVDADFLEWLIDPKLNGAGALMDFGCYGANLCTWLMKGERPHRVTAITQQLQKKNNPLVDDEAIILLQYDEAVAIIQASWNWPIGRKDMELYGLKGAIYADNRNDLRIRISEGYDGFDEDVKTMEEHDAPMDDPFAYFAAVIRGDIQVGPTDLSSIENNLIVMEILDAALRSAKKGKSIKLKH